jgi:hypothetical protein
MPLITHFAVTGMDDKKYAEVLRRLEAAGQGTPRGRLHHTCYGTKDSLVVVDIYDTKQNFENFGQTLVPILASLGIVAKPEVQEVHNIIRQD